MATYREDFLQAIARTRAHKFALDDVYLTTKERWLDTSSKLIGLEQAIELALAHLKPEALFAQCLAISCLLEEPISQWLGCSAYLTIGWLDNGTEKGLFKFDDAYIEKISDENYAFRENESMHAWLTLPTLEIIDVTYHTTNILANKLSDKLGRIIATHADKHPEGLVYKPMIVGRGFLKGRK
jgi:hypothetical protein